MNAENLRDQKRQASQRDLELAIRSVVGFCAAMIRFTAMLLVPTWMITAGFRWRRGWEAILILALVYLVIGSWLWVRDPGLLRQRLSYTNGVTGKDRLATKLIGLCLFAFLIVVSIDVQRLHLLPSLPDKVSFAVGLLVQLTGYAIVFWTFYTNSFAAPVVRIQHERKQKVIDWGPYAQLRHPMYAGVLVTLAGVGVFLESTASLALIPLVALGFLPRIMIEERVLSEYLPGYTDYLSRVRWRLVPGIF